MKENKNLKKITKDKKITNKKEVAKEVLEPIQTTDILVDETVETINIENDKPDELIEKEIGDSIIKTFNDKNENTDELIEKTTSDIEITKIELSEDKYFSEETIKNQIILHTTGTGNGLSDEIKTFVNGRQYFTTHFIIGRDGNIYQLLDDKYWAYHLNLSGHIFKSLGLESINKELEMGSISIEIDSYGEINKVADNKYRDKRGIMTDLNNDDVMMYNNKYYEKFTEKQLTSLNVLLKQLGEKHNIDLDYRGESIFKINKEALKGENGIFTEASYNVGNKDCYPQPELIDLLKNLK